MNSIIYDEIESALSQESPIEALRQLAIDLNGNGIEKVEILKNFYAYDMTLKSKGMDEASDYLEEVIDMMTGYYIGRNLDLK
jgi:hypothetical protein